MTSTRSVLHVLPHPGGGGATYVDALEEMDGYRFERAYLAPSAKPVGSRASIVRKSAEVHRLARAHDVVHVHGEVASTLCLPTLARRPSVVTLHGLHLLRRLNGARKAGAGISLRLIVRSASKTICVSRAEYDEVVEIDQRTAERLVVIHNGVEMLPPPTSEQRAAARAELEIDGDRIVAVSVGSLEEHKDPLALVRAARQVAQGGDALTLLLAGDGPLRPELERLGRDEPDAVRVLGFRADVVTLLAAADFFVLSSLREGLSFSLLEAMSLGLPVIVSDAPGNVEVVADDGIVVGFGDIAGFAAAFRRLMNQAQRIELGERARQRVREHFTAADMVKRTRDVYDRIS